jgi:hypothetical protein
LLRRVTRLEEFFLLVLDFFAILYISITFV